MSILRVLGGLALIIAGIPFVLWTQWFMENFGAVGWAEEKLGPGGSWLFYKLIGIGISIIGMLLATGLLGGLILGTIGRLFVAPK